MSTYDLIAQVFQQLLPYLPVNVAKNFGSFIYSGYDPKAEFTSFKIQREGEEGQMAFVNLFPRRWSDYELDPKLNELKVVVIGKESVTLTPGRIQTANISPVENFPSFEYEWNSEGRLIWMRIALAPCDIAFYMYRKDWGSYQRNSSGLTPKTRELPETLDGLTELLGVPIPFHTDFEERAREILELSHLLEFAEEVKKTAS